MEGLLGERLGLTPAASSLARLSEGNNQFPLSMNLTFARPSVRLLPAKATSSADFGGVECCLLGLNGDFPGPAGA
jgi:hypothetical protein